MPSANNIISGALRLAKLTAELQPADPYKTERGREVFNDVVSAWGASGLYIPLQAQLTFPMVTNQSVYTFGKSDSYSVNTSQVMELMEVTIQDPDSPSIIYFVNIINERMYANISYRATQNVPSLVLLRVYQTYSELIFQSLPFKVLNAILVCKQKLETVTPTQIDIDYGVIPDFAMEALKFKIAKRLMHMFGKTITNEFSRDHDIAEQTYLASNLTIDPYVRKDVTLSGRGAWANPGGYY